MTNRTVLVVDDSSFAQNTTIVCLCGSGLGGCEFLRALNGKEALEILRHEPIDLIVTDLNMPVMDGVALIRRVRANPKFNRIPVVVVSSVVGPTMVEELESLGASRVLKKPLSGPVAGTQIRPLLGEAA